MEAELWMKQKQNIQSLGWCPYKIVFFSHKYRMSCERFKEIKPVVSHGEKVNFLDINTDF